MASASPTWTWVDQPTGSRGGWSAHPPSAVTRFLSTVRSVLVLHKFEVDESWPLDSWSDRDQHEAERWGLNRLRELQRDAKSGVSFHASLGRFRYVDYTFDDSEYGTVEDVAIETDYAFNAYSDGVTWHDDHDPESSATSRSPPTASGDSSR